MGWHEPKFLWPRTPPSIPHNNLILPDCPNEFKANHNLEPCSSPFVAVPPSPSTTLDQDEAGVADVRRKEMKIEFYHFLATKRASALNRLSAPHPITSEKSHRTRGWRKVIPRAEEQGR